MRTAPIAATWAALQNFYHELAQELHRRGVSSLTTGGIACVLYDLAQTTKDCDLIIPVEKTQVVSELLSGLRFQGQGCHLTIKYGAPFDARWLEGGWSSHAFFGSAHEPLARVDFFGRPPRVRKLLSDENPLYLSRDGVAWMKKTRREKDWAYANLLGYQMLSRGNPQGLMHVTDSKPLIKAAREIQITQAMIQDRPLLKLAISGSEDLERYLKAEKEFWTRLDDLRLTTYERAWAPYRQALLAHPELVNMDFQEQNQAMIKLAERALDPAPLKTFGWEKLVEQAKAETSRMFQNLDMRLLPNPIVFLEEGDDAKDPVCSPKP